MLDNSPYQARLVRDGKEYDEVSWDAWVAEKKARPLAAAAQNPPPAQVGRPHRASADQIAASGPAPRPARAPAPARPCFGQVEAYPAR